MTTTTLTTIELAITELLEHTARLHELAHQPFADARIALHKSMALECLDLIAAGVNGDEAAA